MPAICMMYGNPSEREKEEEDIVHNMNFFHKIIKNRS